MAIVVSNSGEVEMLTLLLAGNLTYHLYSNDYTPVEGSVVGNFTEATLAGYSAETITGGTWTIGTTDNITSGSNDDIDFILTGAGTVYGYYVTNGDGDLMWSERFTSEGTFTSEGGSITITPLIILD